MAAGHACGAGLAAAAVLACMRDSITMARGMQRAMAHEGASSRSVQLQWLERSVKKRVAGEFVFSRLLFCDTLVAGDCSV